MKAIWIGILALWALAFHKYQGQGMEARLAHTKPNSKKEASVQVDTLALLASLTQFGETITEAIRTKTEPRKQSLPDLGDAPRSEIPRALTEPAPVPPEGEFFVLPPIDTSGYSSLDEYYGQIFEKHPGFLSDGFDFPVGKPDMRGYYIAQRFRQNRHLGDDYNGVSGGDTDLGDPVYSIGHGFVTFAYDLKGGWGKTVRVVHRHPNGGMVESLYSHLDEMYVGFGQFVMRGEQIGTIGTADGQYAAHLHLELRTQVNLPLGQGYADHPEGYTAPTPFIRNNRPLR